MAKNFHLNYKQMWKTVHMCKYMENEEIVVNSESYEPEDGSFWSATCSRCGCTAMSHDMRCAP